MRLVKTGWLGDCHPLHPPYTKIFAKTNYSEPCQTSKMELFAKINNAFSCYIFLQTLHLRCSTEFWTRLWNSSKFIATHQDYWALHVPKAYQISGVLIFANSWKLILANIVTILDPWKKVHVKKVKFWKLNFTPE